MHVPSGRLHPGLSQWYIRPQGWPVSDQPVKLVSAAEPHSSTSRALPTSPISTVYPHSLAAVLHHRANPQPST